MLRFWHGVYKAFALPFRPFTDLLKPQHLRRTTKPLIHSFSTSLCHHILGYKSPHFTQPSPTASSVRIMRPEDDHDHIDYTQANAHEHRRLQRSQELIQTAKYSRNKVRTGFISDEEFKEFQGQDVVFDVLPSFEMYQTVQNRAQVFLGPSPDYFGSEMGAERSDISASTSTTPRTTSESTISPAPTARESISSYSTVSSHPMDRMTGLVRNVVDNTHKLPNMPIHPKVTVEIHVTKSVPIPGEKPEKESMLKEYTSGDGVYGYVIIANQSNERVAFDMFNIRLEGVTSVVDTQTKKIYNKRFLNMLDMNASWTFACISPSNNVRYEPFMIDWDGSTIGISNERILEPKTNYKKFFYFKVPYTLLDNSCRHQQELHTLLPPSFGINRYNDKGKNANITINPALHYGHNGTRGSPVLTKDLSNGSLSVNYSIHASLIGSHPNLRDEFGESELAVMRTEQHALRFIPFGFSMSLFSSRKALDTLKRVIESSFLNAERFLKLQQELTVEEVTRLDMAIKEQQLQIGEWQRQYGEKDAHSFPLRNDKMAAPDFSKIETSVAFVGSERSLFGRKPSSEGGMVHITTRVPKDGLQYVSPPLIRRVNQVSTLNETGMQNIDTLTNTLSMNEKRVLTDLDFELQFKPSTLTKNAPEISLIKSSLLAVNIYSNSAIPIKLSSDILLGRGDGLKEMKTEFSEYYEKMQSLAQVFKEKGHDLSRYVDRSTQEDIKAMKEMKSDVFTLNVLKNKLAETSSWKKGEEGWTKRIKLSLEYHDDITETLVPNFQTCLLTRLYCIQVDFKFRHCEEVAQVRVPIRLRWFDNELA